MIDILSPLPFRKEAVQPTVSTVGNEEGDAKTPQEDNYNIPREEDPGITDSPFTKKTPTLRKLINKPNIMSPSLNLANLTQRSIISSPQSFASGGPVSRK